MKYTLFINEQMTPNGLIKRSSVEYKTYEEMKQAQDVLTKFGYTSEYLVN